MEDHIEESSEQENEFKINIETIKSEILENNINVTEQTTVEEMHVGTEVICIDLEESDKEESEGEEIKTLKKEMEVSNERQNKMLKKIALKENNLKDLIKIVEDKNREIDAFKLQECNFKKEKASMNDKIESLLLEEKTVKSKLSKEMENNVNLEVELAKKTKDWSKLAAEKECKIISVIAELESQKEDVKKKESEIVSLKLEIEKLMTSDDRKSYKTQSLKLGAKIIKDKDSNVLENAQETSSVSDFEKINGLEKAIKKKDCKIMPLISNVEKQKEFKVSNSKLAENFNAQPLKIDVEQLEEEETYNDKKDEEIQNLKSEIEKLKCSEREKHSENEFLKAKIEKLKQSEEKKDSDVKSLNLQVEQLEKEIRSKNLQIKSLEMKINELKLQKNPQKMADVESNDVCEGSSSSSESEEKQDSDKEECGPPSKKKKISFVNERVIVPKRKGSGRNVKYSNMLKTIPNDKHLAGTSKTTTADVENDNVCDLLSSSESEENTDSDSDEYVSVSKKKNPSHVKSKVIPRKRGPVKEVYSDGLKTIPSDKQAAGTSKTADEDNFYSCDDLPISNIQASSKYAGNQKTSVTTGDKAVNSEFSNNTVSSDISVNLDSNRDNSEEKYDYDQGTIYYQKNTRRKPTHLTMSEMVTNAIKSLKKREGSSLYAIKKYITANYKVDANKLAPFINKYLKSAVKSRELIWTNGIGASGYLNLANGSFCLAYSNSSALSKSSEGESKRAVPDVKSFEDLLNDPRVEFLEKYYSPRAFPNKTRLIFLARRLSISVPIIREWFRKKWQNENRYVDEEDLLVITEEQLQVLENVSKKCIYPTRYQRLKLSNQLDIPMKQVTQWFNMKISGKRGNPESFEELLNDPRVKLLENYYSKKSHYLSRGKCLCLAYDLSISEHIIREWFRNKRQNKIKFDTNDSEDS